MDNSQTPLSLPALIEAILFYTAEPMSARKLSSVTKFSIGDVREAAKALAEKLESNERGICLVSHDDEYALGTTAAASSIIEEITKEELTKELSKASLETLSIVCYKGPLTRADIDYIRGVNSTFILRNLLIRGIVEKRENPKDLRAALYAPTMLALEYMGITRVEDLPNYDEVQTELLQFVAAKELLEPSVTEEKKIEPDDSSESEAILCDTDGDGVLSEEECQPALGSSEDLEQLALIAESDLAAPQFIEEENKEGSDV